MRRKDREMDRNFGLYVIDKARFGVMTTIGEDGIPYSVPVSPAREGDSVYLHSAPEGRKIDNLKFNDAVTMVFVGDTHIPEPIQPEEFEALKAANQVGSLVANKFTTEFESAIITGTAVFVTSHEEKLKGLRAISEKFTPHNMPYFEAAAESGMARTVVIRVDIETLTAKRKKYDADGVEMKWGRME